ncbi:hypothetical protein [Halocynthiibacter namhaensis]|uniref:hypothetical protein n=1 Tax=Halocynthiibacter namhaensis TaxID=1290553 RepID=UPI0005795B3A|nr:hypothetical protein [Halocynthiibacter namhaensis]
MSFIRPEVASLLIRWLAPAMLGLLLMFFLRLLFSGNVVWMMVGGIGSVASGYFLWFQIKLARIVRREGGAGVVEVVEREFSWLTADGGTRFSLDDVVKVEIETNDQGPVAEDLFWYFTLVDGSCHEVGGSAAKGASIVDLLAGFPDADYENVIKASSSTICDRFLIWQKRD